jgi:hypothetical protein
MIIRPRLEPPLCHDIDISLTYQKYLAYIDASGSLSDYYKFITTPSPARERFILALDRALYKADSHSIIEQLT